MDAAALLVLLFLDRFALGAGDLAVSGGGLLHALHFGLAGFHACGFAFAERAGGLALLNAGLLVGLDELVNLYKLANAQARNANYEQILRILNDSLQGSAEGLGIVLGGTPEFLLDTRRGLYSYAALQSRLAENTFALSGKILCRD